MEISKDTNSIKVVYDPTSQPEFIPVSQVSNVTGHFNDLSASTDPVKNDMINAAKYNPVAYVTILKEDGTTLAFHLQDVENQATWLPSQVGLNQALIDINGWL